MADTTDIASGVPGWAHYRPASQPGISCGTCDFFVADRCEMFDYALVRSDAVCDRWEGRIEKNADLETVAPMYTGKPPSGEPPEEKPEALLDLIEALEPTQKAEGEGKLFLISHAKTRYNRPGQPDDIVQGWKNMPIDSIGRSQSRTIGKLLKNQGVSKIYSSDLRRSSQTAEIAGRVAGVPVQHNAKYRPWDMGSLAGHSSKDVLPQIKEHVNNPKKPIPDGESFQSFQDRFLPAFEQLLKQVDNGHKVALVTHSRNVELVQGWLGGNRKKVNTGAIDRDKIDPATVFVIAQSKGGKMRMSQTHNLTKGQAHPAELNLRVKGVHRGADGNLFYRMESRDGHYVGRTNTTHIRAKKGDVLKVQANDFMQSANGDVQWDNPNVVSHYNDTAHSWRELSALAGGELEKDGAPGVAGDIPAAGDMGMSSQMPSGPTLESVHIPVPLPNISISYGPKKLKYQVQKANRQKQLVYGVVLEPDVLDSQDDYMLPDQVQRAAHKYMKNVARGKASVSKLQHRSRGFFKNKPSVVPVESFIAPIDFTYDGKEMVKKGTWVMVLHCEDPNVWEDVINGKYTGLSIGGSGIRQDAPPMSEGGEGSYGDPYRWFN